MASIYFTHRYPEAKIIAIEPEASNFAVLVKNVQPYPTIIPIHAALWNRDGEISVSEPDPSTGFSGKWGFVTHEGPGVKVRAISMPTLMGEMGIRSVDLLKVDIEGAEKEVFEACTWIQDIRALMIELHDRFRPGCSEAVNSVMQGFSKLQRGEITLYVRRREMNSKIPNPGKSGMIVCPSCYSSGYIYDPNHQVCPRCGGSGRIRMEAEKDMDILSPN